MYSSTDVQTADTSAAQPLSLISPTAAPATQPGA